MWGAGPRHVPIVQPADLLHVGRRNPPTGDPFAACPLSGPYPAKAPPPPSRNPGRGGDASGLHEVGSGGALDAPRHSEVT